jgi:hypothetical protein
MRNKDECSSFYSWSYFRFTATSMKMAVIRICVRNVQLPPRRDSLVRFFTLKRRSVSTRLHVLQPRRQPSSIYSHLNPISCSFDSRFHNEKGSNSIVFSCDQPCENGVVIQRFGDCLCFHHQDSLHCILV